MKNEGKMNEYEAILAWRSGVNAMTAQRVLLGYGWNPGDFAWIDKMSEAEFADYYAKITATVS